MIPQVTRSNLLSVSERKQIHLEPKAVGATYDTTSTIYSIRFSLHIYHRFDNKSVSLCLPNLLQSFHYSTPLLQYTLSLHPFESAFTMATSTSSQEKPVSDSHNSPANDTLQSCSVSTEPVMIVTQAGADLLQILAKQVEYYFSTTNLATDTYLSTLRSLNDGYVPVSIIANFAKVRSLVPYDALNAVHQASEDYSDLLEVVFINAETGKRIATSEIESSSATLVAAVGPISGEPIPSSQMKLTSTPVSSPISSVVSSTPVQNTIVLREVPQGIQEAQVRRLFTFEKCPTIQEVHRDVASCW